jgi:hypothetical protein
VLGVAAMAPPALLVAAAFLAAADRLAEVARLVAAAFLAAADRLADVERLAADFLALVFLALAALRTPALLFATAFFAAVDRFADFAFLVAAAFFAPRDLAALLELLAGDIDSPLPCGLRIGVIVWDVCSYFPGDAWRTREAHRFFLVETTRGYRPQLEARLDSVPLLCAFDTSTHCTPVRVKVNVAEGRGFEDEAFPQANDHFRPWGNLPHGASGEVGFESRRPSRCRHTFRGPARPGQLQCRSQPRWRHGVGPTERPRSKDATGWVN